MNSVIKRINDLRIKRGLSQNEFARLIGVSANTVYHWNKTDAMPALSNIERICEVFGLSVEQFFHGIDGTEMQSDEINFLEDWRAMTPDEREAIQKVIEAFTAIRGGRK